MELLEVIQRTVGQYMKGSGLTDLAVGTVTGVTPLKITLEATRLEVGGEALWLTEGVVEKKIPVLAHGHPLDGLSHSHTVSGLDHGHGLALTHIHTIAAAQTEPALDGAYAHAHRVTAAETGEALGGAVSTADSLSGAYPTSAALRSGVSAGTGLDNVTCVEHGTALPVREGYILLNRGLETGDKVLLLRVLGGQGFIILSRIFKEGS